MNYGAIMQSPTIRAGMGLEAAKESALGAWLSPVSVMGFP